MDHRTSDMLDSLADLFLTDTRPAAAKPRRDDALEGPPPIRLSPKLHASSPRVPPTPHLRMTEDDRIAHPDAETLMELVFLGNLPGFAGPWLTQYAQWCAGDSGAVGVLRLDEQQVDVELVGRCDDLPRLASDRQKLSDVIAAMKNVKRWLICPGDAEAALVLPHFEQVMHWTLLCGSNDPAVLGAAQMIRQLLEADAVNGPDAPDRSIALMVMGADEDDARHAATRVNGALNGLVAQPLQLRGSLKQMGPVSVRMLGTYPAPRESWADLVETLNNGETAPQPPPAVAPPVSASAAPQPTRSDAPASMSHAATDDPDLSQFLPGGLSLQARCPKHPQTQLVLDQDGRLHLLRRHAGPPDELYAAVIDLIEARRWVAEHLPLLKLTQRQCTFDDAASPVLHLFTDHGKVAAALTGRLGAFVQLHLLQRVQAGGASTWFCAELN